MKKQLKWLLTSAAMFGCCDALGSSAMDGIINPSDTTILQTQISTISSGRLGADARLAGTRSSLSGILTASSATVLDTIDATITGIPSNFTIAGVYQCKGHRVTIGTYKGSDHGSRRSSKRTDLQRTIPGIDQSRILLEINTTTVDSGEPSGGAVAAGVAFGLLGAFFTFGASAIITAGAVGGGIAGGVLSSGKATIKETGLYYHLASHSCGPVVQHAQSFNRTALISTLTALRGRVAQQIEAAQLMASMIDIEINPVDVTYEDTEAADEVVGLD